MLTLLPARPRPRIILARVGTTDDEGVREADADEVTPCSRGSSDISPDIIAFGLVAAVDAYYSCVPCPVLLPRPWVIVAVAIGVVIVRRWPISRRELIRNACTGWFQFHGCKARDEIEPSQRAAEAHKDAVPIVQL